MRTLKLTAHLSGEQLKERMQQSRHQRDVPPLAVSVFNHHLQVTAADLSDFSGLSASAVYLLIEGYNLHGPDSVEYKPKGGRHHAYLSVEREEKLLQGLSEKAARGEILTVTDIREDVERELGFSVSDDYLWGLFKRHHWKKKAPRPQHVKKD